MCTLSFVNNYLKEFIKFLYIPYFLLSLHMYIVNTSCLTQYTIIYIYICFLKFIRMEVGRYFVYKWLQSINHI